MRSVSRKGKMTTRRVWRTLAQAAACSALFLFLLPLAFAQQPDPSAPQTSSNDTDQSNDADQLPVMLPHLSTDRLWISGQANFITQYHPEFAAPYSGKNSLLARAQDASSRVLTLYTGLRLTNTTEILCDVQESGGHGIGEALGLAGFTNLDVVRNPSLSKAPYIGRLIFDQIIPLSHNEAQSQRTPF